MNRKKCKAGRRTCADRQDQRPLENCATRSKNRLYSSNIAVNLNVRNPDVIHRYSVPRFVTGNLLRRPTTSSPRAVTTRATETTRYHSSAPSPACPARIATPSFCPSRIYEILRRGPSRRPSPANPPRGTPRRPLDASVRAGHRP